MWKSAPFFYFWRMRFALAFLILFILPSSFVYAQSDSTFLHERGYLISAMDEMSLEENRIGWWRLSPAIAVRMGLEVGEGFDERMDPLWSTQAAHRWWKELFRQFEDTLIADYAFIYGPSEGVKMNFNATKYLRWKNRYEGLKNKPSPSWPHLEGITQEVSGSLYWIWLEDHFPAAFVEKNNPAIVGQHLNVAQTARLRLPVPLGETQLVSWHADGASRDSAAAVALDQARNRILNDIPDPRTHERIVHRVRSGEFLGVIAGRYRVGVSDLKKWNNLRSDMIRVGQELLVYVPESRVERVAVSVDNPPVEGQVRSDEEDRKEEKYTVKAGDTLWSIARNYPGVSADDIMRWNGINEDIREGQSLLILPPNRD